MTEAWKTIPGFTRYSVSDQGRVRRDVLVYRSKAGLCSISYRQGYAVAALTSDAGKHCTETVHSLVMLAFVGPRPPGMHVCHTDGDRGNPRLSNLRYDTPTANVHDAIKHGTQVRGERVTQHVLAEPEVRQIVAALEAGSTYTALADRFSVTKSCIYRIAAGNVWRDITGGIDRRNGYKFAHVGGQARWARVRAREGAGA